MSHYTPELHDWPTRGDNDMEISTVTVTPQIAEAWMMSNTNNRSIRKHVVAKYANAMSAGDWQANGETIKFSATGRLIDGQHRLSAVIASGVTCKMTVVRGLDDRVISTIDKGPSRTDGDDLKIMGEKNPNILASAARVIVQYESGKAGLRYPYTITTGEVIMAIKNHPIIRSCVEFSSRRSADLRGLFPVSVYCACVTLCSEIDASLAHDFFGALASGENISGGMPVYALRRRLHHVTKPQRTDLITYTAQAWNAARAGVELSRVSLPSRKIMIRFQ